MTCTSYQKCKFSLFNYLSVVKEIHYKEKTMYSAEDNRNQYIGSGSNLFLFFLPHSHSLLIV